MTDDDALADLLELVVEEETGLFEVVWRLQTLEVPEAERRPLAERAVRGLLARGWATLHRRTGAGPFVTVVPAEVDAALAPAACWAEPEGRDAVEVRLRATPAGERAFAQE